MMTNKAGYVLGIRNYILLYGTWIRRNLRYRRPKKMIAQGYVSEVMMGEMWVDDSVTIGWSLKIICGLSLYAFSSYAGILRF